MGEENVYLFVPNLIVQSEVWIIMLTGGTLQKLLKDYRSRPPPKNVLFFAPNIIGYGRIVLALISFYYMPTDYVIAGWCYILSGLLDAFDGHAARMLNQSSKFGAMLDQLTDRAATMCLLVVLSNFYPSYMFLFQLSMTIDIVSHWLHLHSSMMRGSDSHKKIDLGGNPIMRHYYTNRKILFCMCAGNELFYSMLYLIHFTPGPVVPLGPLSFGIFTLICILCAPVAIAKTGISIVHLWVASENIVSIDQADRAQAASEKKD